MIYCYRLSQVDENLEKNKIQKFGSSQDHSWFFSSLEIRFICDTMLLRLGKLLRSCGIDTILANNKDSSHDECVLLALQENRFILSRGSVVKKVGDPFVVHT